MIRKATAKSKTARGTLSRGVANPFLTFWPEDKKFKLVVY